MSEPQWSPKTAWMIMSWISRCLCAKCHYDSIIRLCVYAPTHVCVKMHTEYLFNDSVIPRTLRIFLAMSIMINWIVYLRLTESSQCNAQSVDQTARRRHRFSGCSSRRRPSSRGRVFSSNNNIDNGVLFAREYPRTTRPAGRWMALEDTDDSTPAGG